MKRIVREDFRVRAVIVAESPRDLGLPIDGLIVSGRVELVVAPKRLGDFGFASVSDSMVSSDIEGDYQRRVEEMVRELRYKPQVASATVEFTERAECTHCGYAWEEVAAEDIVKYPLEAEELGLPVCCEQAQAEFRAAQSAGAR